MPHLIVEYSGNLEKQLDMPAILRVVHDAALATGVFPFGGIRTRGERRDLYLIADAHPDNGFIHVQARIGTGRSAETRQQAGEQIFAALQRATAAHFAKHPIGLTLEICEIDPVGAGKLNNVHDYVAARTKQQAS